MTARATLQTAVACVERMKTVGYLPASIGVFGTGARWNELRVWESSYPEAKILGVDLRRKDRQRGNVRSVRTLAGDGSVDSVSFCWHCRSVVCTRGHWQYRAVEPVTTVDVLMTRMPKPYFLWIDVEGYEVAVLEGAKGALQDTEYLNVEVQDYTPGYAGRIHDWLTAHGYMVDLDHQVSVDKLYRKVK